MKGIESNRSWRWVVLGSFLAGGVLAALSPAKEKAAVPKESVEIGLVSSLFRDIPESLIPTIMRPFKSVMEAQTGMTGQFSVAGDALELGRQLDEGKVQMGVFHGFEFAWAKEKYPNLKPLAVVVTTKNTLRAVLVTAKTNGPIQLTSLRGKSVAIPRGTREHCRLFLERKCLGGSERPDQVFSTVTTPRSIEEALDDVVNGVVDGALVDGASLSWYQQRKPGAHAKLQPIQESDEFPAAVFAYQPGSLSEKSLRRFQVGMLSAHETPRCKQLLNLCRINAFEDVPEDYDKSLSELTKNYPSPKK
jgi:ABC-type phosphate/phosphonate transport system substrate-binding protein